MAKYIQIYTNTKNIHKIYTNIWQIYSFSLYNENCETIQRQKLGCNILAPNRGVEGVLTS